MDGVVNAGGEDDAVATNNTGSKTLSIASDGEGAKGFVKIYEKINN